MNTLLWVLQIVLALYNVMGGFWTLKTADKLAATGNGALPKGAWTGLGMLQILFAFGLVLPGALGVMHGYTAIAAVCLAVLMVSTAAIVHSKALMSSGMLWAIIPGILAAFVAYGRIVLLPL
jgi:hypothetical protein